MGKDDDLIEALDINRELSISNSQLLQQITNLNQDIQVKIKKIEKLEGEIRDLNLLRILSQSGILRGMKLDVMKVQGLVEDLINSQLDSKTPSPSD